MTLFKQICAVFDAATIAARSNRVACAPHEPNHKSYQHFSITNSPGTQICRAFSHRACYVELRSAHFHNCCAGAKTPAICFIRCSTRHLPFRKHHLALVISAAFRQNDDGSIINMTHCRRQLCYSLQQFLNWLLAVNSFGLCNHSQWPVNDNAAA